MNLLLTSFWRALIIKYQAIAALPDIWTGRGRCTGSSFKTPATHDKVLFDMISHRLEYEVALLASSSGLDFWSSFLFETAFQLEYKPAFLPMMTVTHIMSREYGKNPLEKGGQTMQAYYEKFVDRMIPKKLEKKLRLGRRSEEERRLMDDRRTYADESYLDSDQERRDSESNRRSLIERRQRWFRTSQYRSRHVWLGQWTVISER